MLPLRILRLAHPFFAIVSLFIALTSIPAVMGSWPEAFQGWSSRVAITIPASMQHTDTLVDFPVYVDLSHLPPEFFGNIKPDGSDIRVTAADGTTELPVEVVFLDTVGLGGQLHFKAASMPLGMENTFYLYFGNPDANIPLAEAANGSNRVWSAYELVMHLEEAPTGQSGDVKNSTGGGSGNSHFVGSLPQVSGRLSGMAYDFEPANQTWVNLPDVIADATGLTVSFWVRGALFDDAREFYYGSSSDFYILVWADNENGFEFLLENGNRVASGISKSEWSLVTATWDGPKARIYVDGTLRGEYSHTITTIPDQSVLRLGSSGDNRNPSTAVMDELRISRNAKSSGWIATEYRNQSDPAAFHHVGAIESSSGGPSSIQPVELLNGLTSNPGARFDLSGSALLIENLESARISIKTGGREALAVEPEGTVVIAPSLAGNSLDVDGTVRAKKVIVNSDWADYVFGKNYRLAPLSEVESHIREHGRLPGLPSSDVVREHGISIGDSQRWFLEKLEELTLHLIEQEKRIEALEKENAELQRQSFSVDEE